VWCRAAQYGRVFDVASRLTQPSAKRLDYGVRVPSTSLWAWSAITQSKGSPKSRGEGATPSLSTTGMNWLRSGLSILTRRRAFPGRSAKRSWGPTTANDNVEAAPLALAALGGWGGLDTLSNPLDSKVTKGALPDDAL